MAKDIFISHSSKNKEYVQKLVTGLEELGFSCWVSYRDIGPLEEWDEAIVENLKQAKYFILILSSFSASSKHVKREVRMADEYNLPSICVKMEDIPMSAAISYRFAGAEYIPAFEHSSIQETIAKIAAGLPAPDQKAPIPSPQPIPPKPVISPDNLSLDLGSGIKMEFVRVPAGEFWMGSVEEDKQAREDEKPRHRIYLDEYWIGKFPLTNAQYEVFVKANKGSAPGHWPNGKIPQGLANHPVVHVSWLAAKAFCEWASLVTRQNIYLPSEAQWEKAARGTDGRIYPWGNAEPNPTLANFGNNIGGTTEVGKYPKGISPCGALDMAGNVWEWAADWYDKNFYHTYPEDQWPPNPTGPQTGTFRVLRGGSFDLDRWDARCALRGRLNPGYWFSDFGFRLALSPSTS